MTPANIELRLSLYSPPTGKESCNKHTKDMLMESTLEDLMQERHVQNLLGSVKHLKYADVDEFYKSLQFYVDSKEKVASAKTVG